MFVRMLRECLYAPEGEQGGAAGSPGEGAAGAGAETAVAATAANGEGQPQPEGEEAFLQRIEKHLDTEGESSGEPQAPAEPPETGDPEKPGGDAEDPEKPEKPDDEPGEGEENEETEQKGWPESAKKRLAKLVAQRNEAREELSVKDSEIETARARVQELEAQIQELQVEQAQPGGGGDPAASLSSYTKPEKLAVLEEQSRDLLDWLDLHPDGGEFPLGNGQTKDLDEQAVRELKVKVRRDLEVNIPRRRQYLLEERHWSQKAMEVFPELKDSRNELTVAANHIVTSFPEIKRLPGWRIASVYYAMGRMAADKLGAGAPTRLMQMLEKAGQKEAKPPARPEPPPPPPPTQRKPAPVTQGTRNLPDEQELVEKGGSYDQYVAALAQRLGG